MNSEKYIVDFANSFFKDKFIFVEIGVMRATNLVYVAENCSKAEKVIGIDSYEAYEDYLFVPYRVSNILSKHNLRIARNKIEQSAEKQKIQLIVEDCLKATSFFENNSIDCIFLDAYMTQQDVCDHYNAWHPKIKCGGLIVGHDIESFAVKNALDKLNVKYDLLCEDTWITIKN